VSESTARRLVDELENMFHAPVLRIPGRGIALDKDQAFELPGLWFSPDELFALMTAQQLLESAEPGLVGKILEPLKQKIERLLDAETFGAAHLRPKLRLMRVAGRGTGQHFSEVAKALIEGRQLEFGYRARTTREETHRKVSPQLVTHYRDNWYLDAYCHDKRKMRRFAIDRIEAARVSRLSITKVSERSLEDYLGASYGVFAGKAKATADLIFNATSAEWVADETWHERQQGEWLDDGTYRLRVPYADMREIARDLMRYGADVMVVAPAELREFIAERHRAAAAQYESAETPRQR
jgi:predicted DNA-binding transcriptional regulator YafY